MPPKAASKPQTPAVAYAQPSSTTTQQYLLFYNFVCFALWTTVTLRAATLLPILASHNKVHGLFKAIFPLLKWTQTIAILEIVHSLVGLVRAKAFTTAMQVASRLGVVWAIGELLPEVIVTKNRWGRDTAGAPGTPYAFAGCVIAWGVTEIIRYGYFVWREGISGQIPSWLNWLRYNTFFVLYPMGISSECWLIYNAIKPAEKRYPGLAWGFKALLLVYVPGSYILYTHMMAQRRKVLKGKQKST
jgi:very-long-chain (3R)-3-hydroxyacyl-CoA dehydratase